MAWADRAGPTWTAPPRRARPSFRPTARAASRFTPRPAGLALLSHPRLVPGADLTKGTYSGQVGAGVHRARNEPGNYDREVFLVLKEFEPTLSRGGDMATDFLADPRTRQGARGERRGAR